MHCIRRYMPIPSLTLNYGTLTIVAPEIKKPLSLITGASAGIGAVFARVLAARGHNLVLTARRHDRLEALARELTQKHGCTVTVLSADLTDPDTPKILCDALAQRQLQVDWLINNAGYAVPGKFIENDWSAHADMLQVLLHAPTELAWRVLSGMRQRGAGTIINVASLAGYIPGTAGQTLYGATKAYLIRFSQCLALENRDRHIRVFALCPGFTHSEFHDRTGTRALVDKLPNFMWQSAETVVQEGLDAMEKGQVVYVTGGVNRFIKTLFKVMPDRLAAWLAARQGRRYRN